MPGSGIEEGALAIAMPEGSYNPEISAALKPLAP
jgi:hypothetical protein